jgi:hypothetical protein
MPESLQETYPCAWRKFWKLRVLHWLSWAVLILWIVIGVRVSLEIRLARTAVRVPCCVVSIIHLRNVGRLHLSALSQAVLGRSSRVVDSFSEQLFSLWPSEVCGRTGLTNRSSQPLFGVARRCRSSLVYSQPLRSLAPRAVAELRLVRCISPA